jgi:hypothetical protein
MKESPRESFRWSAHTGGVAIVKPKDYVADLEWEAQTPYALWKDLATTEHPLRPGDLLEIVNAAARSGPLWIAKYIGFEPANWYVPEPDAVAGQRSDAEPASA